MFLLLPCHRKQLSFLSFALSLLVLGSSSLRLPVPPTTSILTKNSSRKDSSKTRFFTKKDDAGEETNEPMQQVLTRNPLRLLVLRAGLTEPRAISPFNYGKYDGTFTCGYCGNLLFDSKSKYDSGSGWPSFWRTAAEGSVKYQPELDGRLECQCARCSSHLGHVFLDGPLPEKVPKQILDESPATDPRGKSSKYLPRFCINGAAMDFKQREGSQ